MTTEIGLQLFSVKNELQRNYLAALEKVAEIGYKNVELISMATEDGLIFGENIRPSEHRHHLERLGLKAVACHFMPKDGMDWEKVIVSCVETGAPALVFPFAIFNNRQDVLSLCGTLNQVAELGKKQGIQVYYHNHFQEFQKFDGQVVMDGLLENTDRDLVMFEFDTYWAIRGGQDPIAWIRKFGKRCDLLHQKDMPSTVQPINLFELAVHNPNMTIMDMFQTIGAEQFTEIGSGTINIPDIIAAGQSYGHVRYIIVEQDKSSKDEMESVAISYENLERILAGTSSYRGY